jgi:hypothetical protein
MSALCIIKQQLADEMAVYSAKLVSFDRVFDEDVLNAKHEQLCIMTTEIETLEMKLIEMMMHCSERPYHETKKYEQLAEKMSAFHERETQLRSEINELLSKRDETYKAWKDSYMKVAERFCDSQAKLRKINEAENALLKLSRNKVKANNNIIMLVYIHCQINTLLGIANFKKENLPSTAFKCAWNNKLIDDETYELLKP